MKIIRHVVLVLAAIALLCSTVNAAKPESAIRQLYKGYMFQMLPILAPDVEWVMLGNPDLVPMAGTYSGYRNVFRHFFEFFRMVRVRNIELNYMFPDEKGRLHLIFSMQGTIRSNGNFFNMDFAHLLSFNEKGLIAQNRVFYDTTSWWAAFNDNNDVTDRKVGRLFNHIDVGNLGASTQLIENAYAKFVAGDVLGVISIFHPTEFLWILKGDAIGDNLGAPDQGIGHVGRFEGSGDPFEQPFPTWGFLGAITDMNFHYEYVPPAPPNGELPFLVRYLGSNGNLAGAHVQEIQRNFESGQIARIQLYHFFVLDENQKVKLGLSFNDNAALCRVDPNCAFYWDMQ